MGIRGCFEHNQRSLHQTSPHSNKNYENSLEIFRNPDRVHGAVVLQYVLLIVRAAPPGGGCAGGAPFGPGGGADDDDDAAVIYEANKTVDVFVVMLTTYYDP